MEEANVKIIAELKESIAIISADRDILNKFCYSPKDFSRQRKLPFERLVLLVSKLCKKTLSLELEQFFKELGYNTACSVSAFTQQRAKLNPDFFVFLNVILCAAYYYHYGNAVKRWKGYRVIAADGSSVSLINNPALSRSFGGQRNQQGGFVAAKTFYHYDVLNELVLVSRINPYRCGEHQVAYELTECLGDDTIAIYDRLFSNYKMVALHLWQEKERKFVIRAKDSLNMTKSFIKSGQASCIVNMKPGPAAIEGLAESGFKINNKTVLKVRLVRVDLPNSVEVLITNLWEEDGYPDSDFKELYFMRWGVETNIAIQKNTLQLESFSGLTVLAVVQDFYATVFITNLNALLIKDAQQTIENTVKHRKYPLKINKNKAAGRIKSCLITLFISNTTKRILKRLHAYLIKDTIPVRKGRSFKRVKKNTQSKSKFKTFTNFKPAY